MKILLLIAVKGERTQEVFRGYVGLVQNKKKELKNEPQWRGYKWQIRTPEGYKAVPILYSKLKAYDTTTKR